MLNNDPNPAEGIGFLVSDVMRLLRRSFDRRARHLGLTLAQWRTLVHLSRNEGINQSMLAEILEIQPITLTRLIDKLEQQGVVERRNDPDDRRAQCLFLTEAAAPVIEKLSEVAEETRELTLRGLPAAERKQILKGLQTMRDNLMSDVEVFETCGEDLPEARAAGNG